MPLTIVNGPVIAAGESLSTAIDCTQANVGIRRIIMPPAWDSAWLTLQASNDGVTYHNIHLIDGKPFVLTVVPGAMVLVVQDVMHLGYFKFQSGTSEDPVIQTEERVFVCGLE